MNRKILLILALSLTWIVVFSQRVERQLFYGDQGADQVHSIVRTIDGKAVLVGSSYQGPNKGKDVLIRKVDRYGDVIPYLPLYLGAEKDEEAYKVIATHDGGFLICGYTASDWSGHVAGEDAWLLKVNSFFDIEWYVLEGTSEEDYFLDAFQDEEGTFFTLGQKGDQAFLSIINEYGSTVGSYLFPKGVYAKKLIKENQELAFQVLIETANKGKESIIERISFDSKSLFPMERDTIMSNSKNKSFVDYCKIPGDGYALLATKYTKRTGKDIYVKIVQKHTEQDTIFSGAGDDIGAFLMHSDFNDLIIGGKTYSSVRGMARSDAFLIKMDIKGASIDTLNNKTALVWGAQQDDQLNCIEELTDGRLLVGGASKRKSSEAWLSSIYTFKTYLKQKNFTKISANTLSQKDASNDDTLSIGEWGYLPIKIKHIAGLGVNNIRGVLTPVENTEGIFYPDTLFLGNLNKNDSTTYYLPFYGKENLSTGTANFDFHLMDNSGALIDSLPIILSVKGKPKPRLKIIEYTNTQKDFDIYARRDTIIKKYAVINVGDSVARLVNYRHYLPYCTAPIAPEVQNLGDLFPQDTFILSLPFLAKSFYPYENLKNSLLVWSEEQMVTATAESNTKLFSFYAPPASELPTNIRGGGPPIPGYVPKVLPGELEWDAEKVEKMDAIHHEDFRLLKIFYRQLTKEKITKNNFLLVRNNQDTFQLDDKEVIHVSELTFPADDPNLLQLGFEVSLVEGLNQFQLLLIKEEQILKSRKVRLEYIPVKPKLHLLSIGVPTYNLKYTVNDARDMAIALSRYDGGIFDQGSLEIKTEKAETSSNKLRGFPDYLDARIDFKTVDTIDWVLVFISSHGKIDKTSNLRIIGSDHIKGAPLAEGSIKFESDLIEYLRPMPLNFLFFLDVCKAGAIQKQMNDDPGIKEENTYVTKSLSPEQNITYITSSGPDESSWEDEDWENGAFTYALKEAFNLPDKTILDRNNDKLVTLNEFYTYLKKRVPDLIKQSGRNVSQQPMLIGSNHLDLPLFRLE